MTGMDAILDALQGSLGRSRFRSPNGEAEEQATPVRGRTAILEALKQRGLPDTVITEVDKSIDSLPEGIELHGFMKSNGMTIVGLARPPMASVFRDALCAIGNNLLAYAKTPKATTVTAIRGLLDAINVDIVHNPGRFENLNERVKTYGSLDLPQVLDRLIKFTREPSNNLPSSGLIDQVARMALILDRILTDAKEEAETIKEEAERRINGIAAAAQKRVAEVMRV